MATAAHRAAVQTALLSVRGLRRRRLGHVSPTDYPQNGLDKWGRKKLDYNHGNGSSGSHHQYNNYYNNNGKISQSLTNNSLPPLLNGVGRRPVVPRATLVLGGEKSIASKSRRNGLNSSSGGGSENGVATTTSSSTATNLGEGDIGDTDGGGSNRIDLPRHAMEQHEHEQQSQQRQKSNPGSQRSPSLIMSSSSSSLQSILGSSTNNTDDDASTTAATSNPLNNINGTIQHAGSDHSNTSITSNSTSSSSSITSDSNSRRKKKYSSDLIVILDMDECLIHSQFLSDRCVDKYRQVEDRPTNKSMHPSTSHQNSQPQQRRHYPGGVGEEEPDSLLFTNAGCDSFRIHLPDGDLVNVNKRPNLDIFLSEITSKFETYIFTAAVEVYAAPVLNQLDPSGDMFRGRFYREHCRYDPDLGVYAKDVCDVLRLRHQMKLYEENEDVGDGYGMDGYGYDEAAYEERNMNFFRSVYEDNPTTSCDVRRVVLVDNNPLSFLPNPSNGILVSSFYDDPKDDTLEAVMELLHELDESEDVRPILEDRFGLRDALDDVTKGAAAIRW